MSYRAAKYAESLAEFGAPLWLPHSRGWVLRREIPGSAGAQGAVRHDATGCYPLFDCADWSALGRDLADLRAAGLVSLTLVTEPLGLTGPERLPGWFPEVARPYKEHFVVDLALPADRVGSAHHRRHLRRFAGQGRVELCPRPEAEAEAWTRLYDHLIARHGITGLARFSRESFRHQLALPSAVLLRAVTHQGDLAGMQIWFAEGGRAWYHLGAYNELGYRLGGASAALTAAALDHFRGRGLRWADLGSGAGLAHDPDDGLTRHKRGWATGTRWAWLCGAVLDRAAYAEACRGRGVAPADTAFFPAYRSLPAAGSAAEQREVVHGHAD